MLILKVRAVSTTSTGLNKKIFYSILPGNLPSTNKPPSFNVDSNTGELRTGVKLDYETLKEYVITLIAVDERGLKSNAKVYISVEDRNDNSPNFVLSKYEFGKIAEGKTPGQLVEIVNATDADSNLNGLVKYSLQQSKESDMFTINPDSGEIRTAVVFDREVTPKITFHVKAEDQAVPPEPRLSSFVYVTIQVTDVNDNSPEFKLKVCVLFVPSHPLAFPPLPSLFFFPFSLPSHSIPFHSLPSPPLPFPFPSVDFPRVTR